MAKKKKQSIVPNTSNIVNIDTFKNEDGIPTLKEKNGYFNLQLYLDNTIFYNDSEYNKFIKAVERMVRTSPYYKEYIGQLKNLYGLNYCMFLGNVTDEEDVSIEMHHGPLMTLYDVISLITNHCLANNAHITTFSIADKVLQEHFENNVQVIMLSKTVHEMAHKGKIFIHPSQTIGDINALLEKYSDGITNDLVLGINRYLDLCKKYKHSTDNGYLTNSGVDVWNEEEKAKLLDNWFTDNQEDDE